MTNTYILFTLHTFVSSSVNSCRHWRPTVYIGSKWTKVPTTKTGYQHSMIRSVRHLWGNLPHQIDDSKRLKIFFTNISYINFIVMKCKNDHKSTSRLEKRQYRINSLFNPLWQYFVTGCSEKDRRCTNQPRNSSTFEDGQNRW